jgi:hypothetical protein
MLVALGTITSQQSKDTQTTAKAPTQLLNYAAAHPDATVRYHTSDMYLRVHSDASYLSEASACSSAGGIFFVSKRPTDPSKPPAPTTTPPPQNGAIHIIRSIMRNVMASAAMEAELGALFHNARYGIPLHNEHSHRNGPRPGIHTNSNRQCMCCRRRQWNCQTNADQKPLTCVFIGYAIASNKANSLYIGVKTPPISLTISQNTTPQLTTDTNTFTQITYLNGTHQHQLSLPTQIDKYQKLSSVWGCVDEHVRPRYARAQPLITCLQKLTFSLLAPVPCN